MTLEDHIGRSGLIDIERAWNAAARDWDTAALSAVYTADALLFGGRPGHASGADSLRNYFESYASVIRSATLEFTDQHLFDLGRARYLAQGYGRFTFQLGDGRSTRSVLRTTLLIAGPTSWKIQAQHFSPSPDTPPLGG